MNTRLHFANQTDLTSQQLRLKEIESKQKPHDPACSAHAPLALLLHTCVCASIPKIDH